MKWFKHEVDAEEGKIVAHVVRKYGLEGEARYWRLVGLLAKNFPPDKKGYFTFALETIQKKLSQRSIKDTTSFVLYLAEYRPLFDVSKTKHHPFIVECSENHCRIKYDKIAEIKDNHTTNLQANGKRLSSDLALDKNKRKNKNKSENTPSHSLNAVAIAAEIQNLLRTHSPSVDLTGLATDGAKLVLAKYSRSLLGESSEFELSQLVREVIKSSKATA